MRRENTHYIVFPEYFDKNLTRKEGRRLPLNAALDNPTLLELKLAAEKLEYDFEIDESSAYPRQWWEPRGRIFIEKKSPKLQTLKYLSTDITGIVLNTIQISPFTAMYRIFLHSICSFY